ncbi:MAG TPA: hypothetical protein VHB99_04005 [Pirellulales bacterium]|nr:hypothetical protein [Pirellulales bacterium]
MKHQIAVEPWRRGAVSLAGFLLLSACMVASSNAFEDAEEQGDFKAYPLRRARASAVEPAVRQALSALSE